MDKLNQEQQQLVLDFYFRCGDQNDIEKGRDLIAALPGAAKLYADLESTLTDLDHVKYEACPDNLVDLTIARLKLVAASSRKSSSRLNELLEQERNTAPLVTSQKIESSGHSRKNYFLRPIFEVLAAAASIAIVAGILFPSFGFARSKYQQVACQNNMRTLGAGFASFMNDYNNNSELSQVKVKAGSPWWKVGDQGQQVQSNTRLPFMLVKGGYVDGRAFMCKGDENAKLLKCQGDTLGQLFDFPSHKNVSYSFTLFCDNNTGSLLAPQKVIAGDLNPVFKRVRCEKSAFQEMDEFIKLRLNEQLKQSMSENHSGRGQNLLYGDGSVKYTTTRVLNGDDIFTVNGVDSYTGREVPTRENDIFLAP